MAFQVLRDCKTYWDGYDLTGNSNKVALKYSADILEDTVFGAASKSRLCGLKNVELDMGGFWEAGVGKVDTLANSNLALPNKTITLGPTGAAQGEPVFSFQSVLADYQAGAQVGELLPFDFKAQGSDQYGLIKGTVLENGTKTSSASGTARLLGAVGATQRPYFILHVLALSGTNPELTLYLEHDDNASFTSPTITSQTGILAVGGYFSPGIQGAITDTYWRVRWVLSGTNPSFTFMFALGIQ